MPQVRPVKKIQRAARYFAKRSRDLQKIAKAFHVSKDTVRKWAKTPEWTATLDALGYTGNRQFAKRPTRDPARDAGPVFTKARKMYHSLLNAGEPHHKLASLTAKKLGLTRRRVYEWAEKYNWRADE